MPIDFPNSPTNGDLYSAGGKNWQYNGSAWVLLGIVPSIPVGSVGTSELASSAVTTAKIADANVTAEKLAATAAIQPTIVDAKGDLIVGTANDTVARLAVGSNNQTLVAASGETTGVKWGFPLGSVIQVIQAGHGVGVTNNTNTLVDTGVSATITPSSSSNKVLIFVTINGASKEAGNAGSAIYFSLRRGDNQILAYNSFGYTGVSELWIGTWTQMYLDSPATTSATTYKVQFANMVNASGVNVQRSIGFGWQSSWIQLLEIAS